jgi:predicted nuclease with TOPRIM domain
MTNEELSYLRRHADSIHAEQLKRNMDNLDHLRDEVQRLAENLSKLDRNIENLARDAAGEAVKETLKLFGLSPEDQPGIEELRATMRFSKLIHGLVQRGLLVGVGIAVTLFISAIAVKMGWSPK